MRTLMAILLFLAFGMSHVKAQEESGSFSLETSGPPPTIDLTETTEEDEEIQSAPEKKKRKRKVFYGIKTKRYFTKRGQGDNAIYEEFYYPKKPVDPVPFVTDIHWYDPQRKQIRVGGRISEDGVILHGPYRKIQGEQILEEGIFYKGAKHGRWTEYSRNDILTNKEKYIKGWPKESRVNYYDYERTKLREIIPIVHGEKHGTYYMFFENGRVAIKGEYKYDRKVGVWTEYHVDRNSRKREIMYAADPYDKNFRPYIRREWDNRSRLIYESNRQ